MVPELVPYSGTGPVPNVGTKLEVVPELVPYSGTKPVPTGRNLHSSSQVHKTEMTIKLSESKFMALS